MCKILKNIFWKCFFQKRFVLMVAVFVCKKNWLFITSVKATIVQASNQRLHTRRFNDCTSLLNRRLHKRWVDDCTRVESTVGQVSNRRLYKRPIDAYNRRTDGYIDYFLKKCKIARCPFSATIQNWVFLDLFI